MFESPFVASAGIQNSNLDIETRHGVVDLDDSEYAAGPQPISNRFLTLYTSRPSLTYVPSARAPPPFSFLAPHDGTKDHHVPTVFSTNFPDDMSSLNLTGDLNLDDLLALDDQEMPRKRDRGERIVWTPEEDEFLRAAVQKYGDKTEKWAMIAACVPGRTNKNCRKRWFHSLDPKLKKGPWSEEEDHLLKTGVQKFKGQWSKIAERIPGRTDDQCAKRWRESLDPRIDRAEWTPEDDVILLQKFEEYGTQWQKIALSFPGRPGLHCRNRWRKIQRRQKHMQRKRRRMQSSTKEGQADGQTSDDGSGERSGKSRPLSSDDMLLRDAFLDDDYAGLEDSNDSGLTDADKDDGKADSNPDEDKPYGCAIPDCNFESSSPSLLFYHFKASHHGTAVQKPFRCTMTGCEDRKRYKNINGLQYHVTHAKNTPGHSGHGKAHLDSLSASTQSSGSSTQQPTSSASTDTSGTFPAERFVNPRSTTLSAVPTPAELQSLIPSPIPQTMATRKAFNIPHTSDPSEDTRISSSPSVLDIALPQSQPATLQCPEIGCGQTFSVIRGLNAHMVISHQHRSLTLKDNDAMYRPNSISITENDFEDIDMDMNLDLAFLASGSASPMESNLLMLDDSQVHSQLDSLSARGHRTVSLESTPSDAAEDFGMLAINELLANPNFDESITFSSTPASSANVSPRIGAIDLQSGNQRLALQLPSQPRNAPPTGGKVSMVKRFPCLVVGCPKSYGSNATLRTHMRNEHPSVYTKPIRLAAARATPPTGEPLQAMEGVTSSSLPTTTNSVTAVTSTSNTTLSSVSMPGSPIIGPPASHAEVILVGNQVKQRQNKKSDDITDKPYKCLVPGCGRGYTNINGLKNHLLQAHGSTPNKHA
ncbi:hypothetical protein BG011_009484 [Mortierella polycephala]|uniref:Uncharacterized protein n=1 Tax=Mortierella polycephala TaxID=41804 RepID=A0A9P6U6S4_9FUNG|nr:hypothetical protein BG011_009484 [Mortierella polycephala]